MKRTTDGKTAICSKCKNEFYVEQTQKCPINGKAKCYYCCCKCKFATRIRAFVKCDFDKYERYEWKE